MDLCVPGRTAYVSGLMLGLFNIFGRANSLKAFDQTLRDIGMHPRVVPEAVKLAAVRLVEASPGATGRATDADYVHGAMLLGYCILGQDQFTANTGLGPASVADSRVEAAITSGEGLDASLILLALHSGAIHPDLAERFDVETG